MDRTEQKTETAGTETNWDRPCPTCKAQPGKPCRRPSGDKFTTVYGAPKFHASRQRKRSNASESMTGTQPRHAFDLADGWCHTHRAYCDMSTPPGCPQCRGIDSDRCPRCLLVAEFDAEDASTTPGQPT